MKSVGKNTLALVEDVNKRFLSWWKAQTSLSNGDLFKFQLMFHQKMVLPNNLVMFIPIIVGSLFVIETLVNLLASALISGAQVKSLHTNKPILVHWKFQILWWSAVIDIV
jgi:hypothetical protein